MLTNVYVDGFNLATYLLADAFRADADTFVVISNDSDLMEPIRLVSQELGYRVGIVNPHQVISRALQRTQPSFTKQIRRGVLAASQFPEKLSDAHGTITKPASRVSACACHQYRSVICEMRVSASSAR